MSEKTPLIVVADDDPGNLILLKKILTSAGYEVATASDGGEVFDVVRDRLPDLFLLDVMMPVMDGLETCRRLKADQRLQRIPVIFITSKDKSDDVLAGFDMGASDYITKPVNKAEVLARVRTHVMLFNSILELERLNQLALEANPLTGLPGNNSLCEALSRAIEDGGSQCVIYCDLDHFKAFNDKYGFARGDKVIEFTAETIRSAMYSICGPGQFLGHIGGDDFSIIVPSDKAEELALEIARRFDESVGEFYDPQDLKAGEIVSVNRQGEVENFPLMALSMGGVDLAHRSFKHYLEVANACAEVKKKAKEMPGSGIYFDLRKDNPPD